MDEHLHIKLIGTAGSDTLTVQAPILDEGIPLALAEFIDQEVLQVALVALIRKMDRGVAGFEGWEATDREWSVHVGGP